jgi:hypothetical protein
VASAPASLPADEASAPEDDPDELPELDPPLDDPLLDELLPPDELPVASDAPSAADDASPPSDPAIPPSPASWPVPPPSPAAPLSLGPPLPDELLPDELPLEVALLEEPFPPPDELPPLDVLLKAPLLEEPLPDAAPSELCEELVLADPPQPITASAKPTPSQERRTFASSLNSSDVGRQQLEDSHAQRGWAIGQARHSGRAIEDEPAVGSDSRATASSLRELARCTCTSLDRSPFRRRSPRRY